VYKRQVHTTWASFDSGCYTVTTVNVDSSGFVGRVSADLQIHTRQIRATNNEFFRS